MKTETLMLLSILNVAVALSPENSIPLDRRIFPAGLSFIRGWLLHSFLCSKAQVVVTVTMLPFEVMELWHGAEHVAQNLNNCKRQPSNTKYLGSSRGASWGSSPCVLQNNLFVLTRKISML